MRKCIDYSFLEVHWKIGYQWKWWKYICTRYSHVYSENYNVKLNDVADYKPTSWTGKIWITGREFDKDEKIKVRVAGEEKEMTALEIYEYLYA